MDTHRATAHVVIINSDHALLALLTEILGDEGYRVSTADYADHNLSVIRSLAPDLIVLDYMWPTEDQNWSLLQILRLDRATAAVPIVLCTGAIEFVRGSLQHFASMGVTVVYKPFDVDQLVHAIAATLDDALPGSGAPSRHLAD